MDTDKINLVKRTIWVEPWIDELLKRRAAERDRTTYSREAALVIAAGLEAERGAAA